MSDTDLCGLTDVLKHLNLESKNNSNVQETINSLITSKTTAMTKYMGFEQVLEKLYTEYYDGDGGRVLYLNQTPANEITSIHIDSEWGWDSSKIVSADYYRIVDESYIVMREYCFTSGVQNIRVIYEAGYTTIPADLKQACIEEVARDYNERRNLGVSSRSDSNGSFTRYEKGFMRSTVQVMQRYDRVLAI